MKKLYVLVLFVFIGFSSQAQIVNIPDANFKAKLLSASPSNTRAKNLAGNYFKIDANNDGEIQESEALAVSYLDVNGAGLVSQKISSMTGINSFTNLIYLTFPNNLVTTLNLQSLTNLEFLQCRSNNLISFTTLGLTNIKELYCEENDLTSLDVQNLIYLEKLNFYYNPISSINLQGLYNLKELSCSSCGLTSLNVDDLISLEYLNCALNQITTLDVQNCINLQTLYCYGSQLTTLFIKNGVNETVLNFTGNNSSVLQYICCDAIQLQNVQNEVNIWAPNCQVNTYCSFVPGGDFYSIEGKTKLDSNTNGCDILDIDYPNLIFSMIDGTNSGTFISNLSGNYSIPVQAGLHTITPILENPTYFNISPTSFVANFPTQTSPLTQDFCVTANGNHQDLEVVLIPTSPARPGFSATYTLIYKNKGNQTTSGYVYLNYSANQNVMTLNSATPNVSTNNNGTLTWDYVNLQPFETRTILLNMTLNTPTQDPALNAGDDLGLAAIIFPIVDDEYYVDNHSQLKQIVVNSYDPNDKTCLEGTTVTPDMIGQYVHYVIRFENTGTFPAENIVVKDMIDLAKFNINTLIPLHSSHDFVTRINGNKVEFIFEGINLPFDDATNDGYIAFKIKTKSTLVLGDTFTNSASIYFDYNFPIITNTTTTTVAALNVQDFDFNNYFTLYPNPAKEVLNVQTKGEIGVKSVTIYNMLGQMVLAYTNSESLSALDVSQLKTGTYFIKLATDKGAASQKFIKE